MGGEDSAEGSDAAASITEQAHAEFARETAFHNINSNNANTHSLPLGPVFIRDFSLKRDPSYTGEGSSLKVAPNFSSALLGKFIASKLRLDNAPYTPPSTETDSGGPSPSSSSYVFQNINAILRPGEGTLLLGPSSSGKTTFMRTLGDILSGENVPNVEGTVRLGATKWDPIQYTKSNLKRTVAFCDQSDLTLTPILTVDETIRFARSCAENFTEEQLQNSMDGIFKLAGLDHVTQTVVGNADIRGVRLVIRFYAYACFYIDKILTPHLDVQIQICTTQYIWNYNGS